MPPDDEALDRVPERNPAPRIEPGRRLVQEDDRWLGDEGTGEVEPPPHAARVRTDEPAGRVGEIEVRQELLRALARAAAAEVVEPPEHVEVLEAGQVLVDGRVLARQADPLPEARGLAKDVDSGDARAPLVGLEERGQDPDGGRLAGAVRAEQPEDGPSRHVQVDTAEGLDVAVALAEAVCLDGGLGRHPRDASEGARGRGGRASS